MRRSSRSRTSAADVPRAGGAGTTRCRRGVEDGTRRAAQERGCRPSHGRQVRKPLPPLAVELLPVPVVVAPTRAELRVRRARVGCLRRHHPHTVALGVALQAVVLDEAVELVEPLRVEREPARRSASARSSCRACRPAAARRSRGPTRSRLPTPGRRCRSRPTATRPPRCRRRRRRGGRRGRGRSSRPGARTPVGWGRRAAAARCRARRGWS